LAVNFKGGFKVVGAADAKHQPPVSPVDCEPVDCEPVECESVVEYETVIEHHHPLSSEEIRFLLMFLKKSTFTGGEMENLVVVTMKLQEEYAKVLDKEKQNK
jgi:hypothetical protein